MRWHNLIVVWHHPVVRYKASEGSGAAKLGNFVHNLHHLSTEFSVCCLKVM